jgi:hypothetical protein
MPAYDDIAMPACVLPLRKAMFLCGLQNAMF